MIANTNQGPTVRATTSVNEPTDRGPIEEIANRSATAGAGIAAAAHAVGLQDHKRLLDMQARNLERAWQMGMRALGLSSEDLAGIAETEADEMGGDVNVAGDTHIHLAPVDQQQNNQRPATPPTPSGSSSLLPWVLTALLAGGGSTALLMNWLRPSTPTPPGFVDTDTSERTTIGLSTGDPRK